MSALVRVLILACAQCVAFTVTSRSRNRNQAWFHAIATIISSAIWFLTFRELFVGGWDITLLAPYVAGSVIGAITGVKVSMVIERRTGASADAHLDKEAE